MTLSESELAYRDCFETFDRAHESKLGIRVEVPSIEQGKYFQMRCNQARKLRRRKNTKLYPDPAHPLHGTCAYDEFKVTVEWDDEKTYVYFRRLTQPAGKIEELTEEEVQQSLPSYRPPLQLPAPAISRDYDIDDVPAPAAEPIITRRL